MQPSVIVCETFSGAAEEIDQVEALRLEMLDPLGSLPEIQRRVREEVNQFIYKPINPHLMQMLKISVEHVLREIIAEYDSGFMTADTAAYISVAQDADDPSKINVLLSEELFAWAKTKMKRTRP